jgi:3beta-hydroxy-delta5-steroid dehydrogenase / steroid delta-isomerase
MRVITGDITNEKIVLDAMRDVDVVIHCAAVIDVGFEPDENIMKRVNVDGTNILLNAAVECKTRYFIFMSTVDVVIGSDQIYFGSEATTPTVKFPIMGSYATTKREAEELVLKANGRNHPEGTESLKTLVLRPTLTYGEGDNIFIPSVLKNAKAQKGVLPKVNHVFIRSQFIYAGNVAWSCLKAKDRIQEDASLAGEIFFVTDDTPIVDPFDFYKPFLEQHGMTVSSWAYPYWLLILILTIVNVVVRLVKPVFKITLPDYMEPNKIRYIANTFFFNRNKSILRLDYDPLFTPEESEARSMSYYKKLNI